MTVQVYIKWKGKPPTLKWRDIEFDFTSKKISIYFLKNRMQEAVRENMGKPILSLVLQHMSYCKGWDPGRTTLHTRP